MPAGAARLRRPQFKRQRNDANDAAAIIEAAQRPTINIVAVTSEEAQAGAVEEVPVAAQFAASLLLDQIESLSLRIAELDRRPAEGRQNRQDGPARHPEPTRPGGDGMTGHQRSREKVADPWLRRMLAEKPPKVVAVAPANRMARVIWALSVKKETRRPMAKATA